MCIVVALEFFARGMDQDDLIVSIIGLKRISGLEWRGEVRRKLG
jgi:hypothetical protein